MGKVLQVSFHLCICYDKGCSHISDLHNSGHGAHVQKIKLLQVTWR